MCLQSLMKFHHCLFKILRKTQNVVEKELQRAITELALSPYFSIMFILWISMCLPNGGGGGGIIITACIEISVTGLYMLWLIIWSYYVS